LLESSPTYKIEAAEYAIELDHRQTPPGKLIRHRIDLSEVQSLAVCTPESKAVSDYRDEDL